MNDIERQMWKGDNEPTSFPHICPFRPDGVVDEQACIELSGGNHHQNINGCCGTNRNMVRFDPCNSVVRRCIVCLHIGRRGPQANAVRNVATGTCNEHSSNVPTNPPHIPLRPVRPEATTRTCEKAKPVLLREKIPETPHPPEQKPDTSIEECQSVVEVKVPKAIAYEKKRRKPNIKLVALEEAAVELRSEKMSLQPKLAELELDEQDIQLTKCELIARAADKLSMTCSGLSTHFYRSIPEETKARWLYGRLGRKRTRSEIKFDILMQVREQFRKKGGVAPRKKELAEVAAEPLGMTLNSTRTYIYDRLTPEQVEALKLRSRFLSRSEQIKVLKKVRREIQEKGLPSPSARDLAEAAAPLLMQKVNSVCTLIGNLNEEVKNTLELSGSRSGTLVGIDPIVVHNAFIGAVAILKFRNLSLTSESLRLVLKLKLEVIDSYLSEHLEVKTLL